jgi:hypothetical protein
MLKASCHCGQVHVTVPRLPDHLTDCNCSVCRRYGVLWGYYPRLEVQVEAAPGARDEYSWGDKGLRFVRCANCGCVMYWQSVVIDPDDDRMGVNARNFDPPILGQVKIKQYDGASA